MPGSGPLIEASIRKLGFDPRDVRLILAGHAHVDHVGGHAYLKKISGAKVAMMREEVERRRAADRFFDAAFREMARRAALRPDGWRPSLAEIEALAIELRDEEERVLRDEARLLGREAGDEEDPYTGMGGEGW